MAGPITTLHHSADMDKHISSVFNFDKPVAFFAVVPFHDSRHIRFASIALSVLNSGIERGTFRTCRTQEELSTASREMDEIVNRIREYTRGRELAVAELESQLGALTQQEQELRRRVEGLQKVPLPAAEYFAQLVSREEKRCSRLCAFPAGCAGHLGCCRPTPEIGLGLILSTR